jgi:multidrug resistance protein, MATE family
VPAPDPEAWLRPAALLRLAAPAALSAILHNAYRPLDQVWVSWLGKEAQGALGACTFVLIVAYGGFLLISAGVGPLVGRAVGAGEPDQERRVVAAGLVGASLVAIAGIVLGLVAVDPIVGLLNLSEGAAGHATTYLRVLFLTLGGLAFGPVVDAAFAARGNTVLPLILQAGVLTGNAVLTPVLVYGAELGVGGAALGSSLAQGAGVVVGLAILRGRIRLGVRDLAAVAGTGLLRRITRIGLPVATGTALYALVYWALLATSIAPLGDAVTAGLGIGFSGLEAFAWPLFLGCSVAAASVVGRCLGAGRPDLARRAVGRLLGPQIALGTLVGAVFYLGGPAITLGFAADADAWREATLYALVLAWSQPFVALEALFEGTLNGAGDTRATFWSTVPYNLLRVPLAWALAFPAGLGAAGIWWAINATTVMKAGTKAALVWRGRWAHRVV